MALAVFCIQAFSFDRDFYAEEYEKYDTAEYVGVSGGELEAATDVLLSYIQDGRDDIDLEATVGGQARQYYNEREKAHMVDVKALYQSAVSVMIWGSVIAAALFAACFVIWKRRALLPVLEGIYKTGIVILIAFAALAVWAAIDFNGFWVDFHLVFFRNDLWLLDPRTDLMIRMFSSGFFFDLVFRILALFLGVLIPAVVAARIAHKRLAVK
jgi:integral membrane protein (TIGR01906 family)